MGLFDADIYPDEIYPDKLKLAVTRIHKLDGEGATKAYCDISIFNSILIKGIRVIEGEKGLFVAMPREEGRDGSWFYTVIPLSRDVKDKIEKLVLEAWRITWPEFFCEFDLKPAA